MYTEDGSPNVWHHEDLHSWGGLQQRGGSTQVQVKSKSKFKPGDKTASPRDQPRAAVGQTLGAVADGQGRPPHLEAHVL